MLHITQMYDRPLSESVREVYQTDESGPQQTKRCHHLPYLQYRAGEYPGQYYIHSSCSSSSNLSFIIFQEIYRAYFNDVLLYIRRLSKDEHIAEEITSETFFKAMRDIEHFRGECHIRVWLCQIAKNCYYSYLKKNGKIDKSHDIELLDIPDPGGRISRTILHSFLMLQFLQSFLYHISRTVVGDTSPIF